MIRIFLSAWLLVLCLALCPARGLAGEAYCQPPLRVGLDEWPPYEYFGQSGKARGLAYEVTVAVLGRMGAKVQQADRLPWSRGLSMLGYGDIDVLVSGVRLKERENLFLYPDEPVAEARWKMFCLFANRENLEFSAPEELAGSTVGTVRGYAYPDEFMLRLHNSAAVDVVNSDETNFRKLVNRRVDYVLSDRLNGLWLVHRLELQGRIVEVGPDIGVRDLYPLFSRKTVSKAFVTCFSEELRRFKDTDEYRALVDRYADGVPTP
ncbi:substrate-binding periplasmic protein [Pseudodesulfovibrio tunisiensis]|uniref:substrate-binding periplasmic protein n=1 Tax=Pseudodesulfovibrio tunisiensis TaxID=463192 RepID=UPI001FB255E9|nr:transporter substrate-binding domain-containing protein [Pseudodesulfovibrio tunisiensis]